MIDIHSHILFGVDDGVKELSESIEILRNMSNNGITDIILTPHYIEYSKYVSNKASNIEKLNIIKDKLKENNININVCLGNEIYICDNIINLLRLKEITSLNNSAYLLIELPMNTEFNNYMDIFHELKDVGFKIILAHPERYTYFIKKFDELLNIRENGIFFQLNLESILGTYGNSVKKNAKKLLKNKCVDFVGSDIHYDKIDYSFIEKSKKKMMKYLTEEELNDIFINNSKKII